MLCEFDYCIYNKESKCLLREIRIDSAGLCDSCEIVALPEKTLDLYKEKRLQELLDSK